MELLHRHYKDINKSINYGYSRVTIPKSMDFHLHDRFEIYFFISGDVNYFIEKKVYKLKYADLLLMNSHEIHKPSFETDRPYERITIHFDPNLPQLLSSPNFDLLRCFTDRPLGENNRISLNSIQTEEIMKLFRKLEVLKRTSSPGSEILTISAFSELLVFINRVFYNPQNNFDNHEDHANIPKKLVPIIEYIDKNLENELSLEFFEKNFFISKYYLSRLFRNSTGINIHDFILYKRLAKAKMLLSEGINVTDTCSMSGFNDYSNFLRVFKKNVGVSPGKYARNSGGNVHE